MKRKSMRKEYELQFHIRVTLIILFKCLEYRNIMTLKEKQFYMVILKTMCLVLSRISARTKYCMNFVYFASSHHTFAWFKFICFLAPKPECTSDPECPNHLACIQEKCKDPCQTNSCGRNAECKVKYHRAICVCLFGYEGDPYVFCEERKIRTICMRFRMT